MRGQGRRLAGLGVLIVLFLGFSSAFTVSARDQTGAGAVAAQEGVSSQETGEAPAETIHPGPQNLKEKWAIGVFLLWMWLSIAVLIAFLRLQVREADRVTELGYDSPIKVERDKRTP